MATPKKARTVAADHLTVLPLDLRVRIASFLPYAEVARLSVLSRPWRYLHLHTPFVDLDLRRYLLFAEYSIVDKKHNLPGLLNDDALLEIRLALHRRAHEGSKVEALELEYDVADPRVKRHADRIIALSDARDIALSVPNRKGAAAGPSTLDLPPSARSLELSWDGLLAPTIAGPGAASLLELDLDNAVLTEWPVLPSLRSIALRSVNVKGRTPFAPAACCQLLEHIDIRNTRFKRAKLDIRVPSLKILRMVDVTVRPPRDHDATLSDVTVDAPELLVLAVESAHAWYMDYNSFTVRAPKLRSLRWRRQFTWRVDFGARRLGRVTSGKIAFACNEERDEETPRREMKDYRALLMQMLQSLLPEVPPESVADIARPYLTLDKHTVEAELTNGMIPEEELTCDLDALMSSLQTEQLTDMTLNVLQA